MEKKKSIKKLISDLQQSTNFMENVSHWETLDSKKAIHSPFPNNLNNKLRTMLENRGIKSLYSHQSLAFENAINKNNFVTVTPTASGKSLCYHLPVIQSILQNKKSRSLYIFPTKALAQDQKSEVNEWIESMEETITCYTYDGDTAPTIRTKIRQAGNIVITNPDMLHSGILPHHTKWVSLFENLEYVVIDELHTYRGVFGSHVANVVRRLKRICAFYGSNPTFLMTSATIANPTELAANLVGEEVTLIDQNGAPSGTKHFVLYNPPVVNKQLGIRRSAVLEVRDMATAFLKEKIQTIVFARSRVRVEMILTYLKEINKKHIGVNSIRGYRGGYLPSLRREIETGLRNGEVLGVVSTNALELGVDIGQLQVCIMTGYPGTIASAWQQAGRAGRRHGESLVIMVASSSSLDQYVIKNPTFFFEQAPETARISPDNLIILIDHIKCAAFELPFREDEQFGDVPMDEILAFLSEEHVLHQVGDRYHWMSDTFPAHGVSLRSASQENVIIVDRTVTASSVVIGEMDTFSALTLLHDEAIYLHQGVQFQVEELDWEEKKAYVTKVEVDYFTDANLAVELKVLEEDLTDNYSKVDISYGDVMVSAMATMFKKIKFDTHENIGSGPIHLPPIELHTNAAWITFDSGEVREEVLISIANVIRTIAPLEVMCDPKDLHVIPQVKSLHSEKPTIFIYDSYPGGIGLSKGIYENRQQIWLRILDIINGCTCEDGCPACIGMEQPSDGLKRETKEVLVKMLGKVIS
ncbi:DEAD/DEAH box helicase [Mangrovibacillus cuniculi]|uniref:DEAD/DEAH box helicase n=1 Tax=Mangrovibacillus cuniculi TaxID=2593652 RepID=A0A7S8CEK1_9BACI|nr:DEAD/DEAH box helicase [Mangrovibacillus cuniculi]QPC48388.1 DEAD/DEAH box helicase [Mangrovibacillus cuniculi]